MKNKYFKLTDDLTFKPILYFGNLFKVSFLINILLIGLIYLTSNQKPLIEYKNIHTRDTILVGDVKLTDSALLEELVKHKCILPSVAVAQAKIESGHYKSTVCKQNKNLFGIKWHKCKYVLGENLNHASYKSYKDNIKCYIHIQNRYLRNIDGRYAMAKGYVGLLKSMDK